MGKSGREFRTRNQGTTLGEALGYGRAEVVTAVVAVSFHCDFCQELADRIEAGGRSIPTGTKWVPMEMFPEVEWTAQMLAHDLEHKYWDSMTQYKLVLARRQNVLDAATRQLKNKLQAYAQTIGSISRDLVKTRLSAKKAELEIIMRPQVEAALASIPEPVKPEHWRVTEAKIAKARKAAVVEGKAAAQAVKAEAKQLATEFIMEINDELASVWGVK